MDLILEYFHLLLVPALYVLLRRITCSCPLGRRRLLWFCPAVLVGVLYWLGPRAWGQMLLDSVLFLELMVFGCLFLRTMQAYRHSIDSYYADVEFTDYPVVHRASVAILLVVVLIYLRLTFRYLSFPGSRWLWLGLFLLEVGLLVYVVFTLRQMEGQTVVLQLHETHITQPPVRQAEKQRPEAVQSEYVEERIRQWIANPKCSYLTEGITINQVADEMGVPPRTLSLYLNSALQQNFNGWINSLRIQEAKQLFRQHPDFSANYVALTCGFSDAAMLSKTFKRLTGLTITEFKKTND